MTIEQDLIRRALAAWHRAGGLEAPASITIAELQGRTYVVARDAGGQVQATYRRKPNGVLRRLRRWPHELEALTP